MDEINPMNTNLRSFINRFYLLLLIIAHVLFNVIWIYHDNRTLWHDYAWYFNRSIEYFELLKTDGVAFFKNILSLDDENPLFWRMHPYRIIGPLAAVPFYFIFGLSDSIARLSSLFFMVIVMLCTYGIGKKAMGSHGALLSVFLLSTYPLFSEQSRLFSPEFASMAMVALSVYLLAKTNFFSNKKYSILFGICFGLGLITKLHFFVGIIGPLVYVLLVIIKRACQDGNRKIRLSTLKNVIYFFLFGFGIALIFFAPHIKSIFYRLTHILFSDEMADIYNSPDPLSVEGLLHLIFQMHHNILSFFYFVIFVISFIITIFLIKREKGNTYLHMILFWFLISHIILTIVRIKNTSYTLIMCPAIALISSFGVSKIPKAFFRHFIITVIVIVGSVQFYAYSFGTKLLPQRIILQERPEDFKKHPIFPYGYILFQQYPWCRPSSQDWNIAQIVFLIHTLSSKEPPYQNVLSVAELDQFGPAPFQYVSNMKGYALKFETIFWDIKKEGLGPMSDFDFVILKTGYQGWSLTYDNSTFSDNYKLLLDHLTHSDHFTKSSVRFFLPDKSTVSVYQRIP